VLLTRDRPLHQAEIDAIMQEQGEDAVVKVFCIDGIIVSVPLREALKRLPYDVEPMQKLMKTCIEKSGQEATFLSAMTADMLLGDIGRGQGVVNINKTTVNAVAEHFGGNPVFGDDHDGILRSDKK
jgi:hypothetical protein